MQAQGTTVTAEEVVFRLDDPAHTASAVRLWYHYAFALPREMERVEGGWEVRTPHPPVDRFEYLFEITRTPGEQGLLVVDPSNPQRVGGVFGDHSVLTFADYRPPAWLGQEPIESDYVSGSIDTPMGSIDAAIWSPADAALGSPLPLLICHDGPEFDRFAQLTRFVGSQIARSELPRCRVALVAPGMSRNERYSANPAYACALVHHVVPWLVSWHPTAHPLVLAGASLGALAALHAEWTHPGTFGGLFLQSGSFFTPATDGQESSFSHWNEITAFTSQVLGEPMSSRPVVGVCCGTAEENLDNNRLLATRLLSQGLDVNLGERRDGHTFTAWRDQLDPHLADLLKRTWT